ncbi:Rieske 2Fe-2S domain-containing protein [Actinomadura sp. WMMB 499]|uniref:Rieske 2Fe-2S domain-containing protein n=1 Tax=Actinomadura sp. WMMB 499 TaxID=1219491 RepID=UPI0012454681|nr:Rieske 2Fe-2S domain-containing protein [Actinomadura sp. WMMB 499]QFG22808.1 Rieske 2Fe-2S domain-containing protein [Actinomadura sp. WMMB 499]
MQRTIRRVEQAEEIDAVAQPAARTVRRMVRPRAIRNLLSGTWLGHPLHPGLTDVTIGAWTMAALLDTVGGREAEPAADLLMTVGVAGAVPTALSGLNDWADTRGPEMRVGWIHALANSTALSLHVASLVMRARGDRRTGRILGGAGVGALAVGAYLGGHLSFVRGVGVNRTAWQAGPSEWTPVADDDLIDDEARRVDADGVPVVLYRRAGRVYALAADCGHMGGPLDEGSFADGCVTCPWHASTFRLTDGNVVRGPASAPQPHYETRIRDGRIEIRVPQPDHHAEEPADRTERSRPAPRRSRIHSVT